MWRLEGVLEASWRRLGGVLELPRRFFVVWDRVSHSRSILRRILSSMKDECRMVLMMKRSSLTSCFAFLCKLRGNVQEGMERCKNDRFCTYLHLESLFHVMQSSSGIISQRNGSHTCICMECELKTHASRRSLGGILEASWRRLRAISGRL